VGVAAEALSHLHADAREFILHVDLDVIAQEEFSAVSVPGSGGLSFEDVRMALKEFARHKNLLGLDVAQYNPDKDPDSSGAKKVVDLLVDALSARLESLSAPTPEPPEEAPKESSANTAA
jgi:arginase